MVVTVKIVIKPHPQKDVEAALVHAARELTTERKSIKVEFPEKESKQVILRFWIPDMGYNRKVDDISKAVKIYCWEFYEDITISFENDRKRKPRTRRRNRT